MRKKKKNWLAFVVILTLVLILILLINFGKSSNNDTKLSLSEKRWIENNKKEVINVSVANNIPIFSQEGEGIFHNFINELENDTKLTFYLIPYDVSSETQENDLYFEVVGHDKVKSLKDDDMVFYKDYYTLIGKNKENISNPSNISNKKIGTLLNDLSSVSSYISSDNVTYTTYKTDEDIKNAIKKDEVDYIAVPKNKYLSYVLENDYHFVYNITELKEAYVLRTSKNVSEDLKNIVKKNYIKYSSKALDDDYNDLQIQLLMEKNNVSEKSKADFLGKKYVFGYIENAPYTDTINNKLIGLDGSYINSFSNVSKASFIYKKYNSVNDLAKALSNGEVDIAPNYYNYSGLSGKFEKIIIPYEEDYVILTSGNNNVVINSYRSLANIDVIAQNSSLAKYLKDDGKANVKTYDKLSVLLSKIDKRSVVALTSSAYELYKNTDLESYRVIYSDKANLNYGFIVNSSDENKTFRMLLSRYSENINYKQLYNSAWKDYKKDSKEISHSVLYLIGAIIILFIAWLFFKSKLKVKKKIKRDETIRYVDPLTSLKNRNYLNKNFSKWENNSIYPQAIIVINLNNLRHVNDVYGHEEGDKLIKLAANVLIRNQLEQSDIIRTDGNEYLIYMVGYEKNKVVAYMRKLYKELSELPYGYGATLGYSMILDDIKSIDDAINEAVLEIRANKEMKNKSK